MVCGAGACAESRPPNSLQPRPIERLRRAVCDGDREQLTDINGDGWADLRRVFDGERLACSEADLNFDRHIDTTRLFDAAGEPVLEQVDLDYDGRIDQQSIYEHGKPARKELDTNFDRMTDTWLWCAGAYLGRLERDRAKQGHVDTWEDYSDGLLVRARYDDNHDGRPERWELYNAGRLVEVREDVDADGKASRTRKVDDSAAEVPAMGCDGGVVPNTQATGEQGAQPQAAAPGARP